ncbi:uncharacterized protein LOC129579623 [Sitodiplosis mosellana]|uniref:uncharacterized protein LOC129579623 n=1 Tax=Sitodiplosis mosellana TaxID=263140 RepID=UPI002444699E|nr:uncharacterized protein LOC129579623 [Sitodiplosis mosellana]
MVPLEYNQKLLELFGFCPNADGGSLILTFVKRITMLWITVGMDLIPTCHFLYAHFDNPELLIAAISPITGFIVVIISYLTFVVEGKRAIHTFTYLRALVNELLSIVFSAQQIIVDWMNDDIDPTRWTITYKISTLYNQHTALGFFLVNLQKCITVSAYFIILTLVPAYFMSICFYIEAICDDFEMVILELDNTESVGHDAMRSTFITVINLQIYAANLFKQMAKVVTGTVFVQVVGDTIFTSTTLFQLQMVTL